MRGAQCPFIFIQSIKFKLMQSKINNPLARASGTRSEIVLPITFNGFLSFLDDIGLKYKTDMRDGKAAVIIPVNKKVPHTDYFLFQLTIAYIDWMYNNQESVEEVDINRLITLYQPITRYT